MSLQAIAPVLLHILTLTLGFAAFYIVSDMRKEQKTRQAGEVFSQLVNFILFLWLAKILLNLPILFRDPLAALAYPSNSTAFYLAVLFSSALLLYGVRRGRIEGSPFIRTLWHILLPATFFHEFVQLAWYGDSYAFGNLLVYAALLALFLATTDRMSPDTVSSFLLVVWAGGMLLNASLELFPSAFGYAMEPWFTICFFIAMQLLIFLHKKRRPINERY